MSNKDYLSIFETDNARNEFPNQLPGHFVWTPEFERLTVAKNHIVLGARGSGKTALVKMLSHEYLCHWKNSQAQKIISNKEFVGTYIPMKLEWIGGLENKNWLEPDDMEIYFQWRLNIASCIAFLSTIRSCLKQYVSEEKSRLFIEREISLDISNKLIPGLTHKSIESLGAHFESLEFSKHAELFIGYLNGDVSAKKQLADTFSLPLFSPLKILIQLLKKHIDFPEACRWFVCLDEAEFLDVRFHKILNSFLRTESSNIFYKITTMPYCHYTLDTNTETSLKVGDDFDYIYIDNKLNENDATALKKVETFIEEIFRKRIGESPTINYEVNLRHLLGQSPLFSTLADGYFDKNSSEFTKDWGRKNSFMFKLLEQYANEATKKRAYELHESSVRSFRDNIARKLSGALLLRHAVANKKGNSKLDIYSGFQTFIRLSDGNPRRAINLINRLWLRTSAIREAGFKPITSRSQNENFELAATALLAKGRGDAVQGVTVEEFIGLLGNTLSDKLHAEPISTDQYGSLSIDSDSSEVYWNLIKKGVGWGLVYPILNSSNTELLPEKKGVFRLAYGLSPQFHIMPRKGKAISSRAMFRDSKARSTMSRRMFAQLDLELYDEY